MNNFTSTLVAIMEKLELLTNEEAKALVKELHTSTLPDTYDASARMMEDLFKKLKIKTATEKLAATKTKV